MKKNLVHEKMSTMVSLAVTLLFCVCYHESSLSFAIPLHGSTLLVHFHLILDQVSALVMPQYA